MATLAPETPPTSPPFHRRRKSWARKLERCCCTTLAYFPLTFVYGLTTWAVWVEVNVSFLGSDGSLFAYFKAALGVALWALANVSYTIAVFTSPGSPLDKREDWSAGRGGKRGGGYDVLPTHEQHGDEDEMPHGNMTTVTAKSTGTPRYCKKCRTVKPDRTHHCSTCKRCVLKMDHHCPWLATCVGLRNYKPFLLFLIYNSLFCWLCFGISASWVWAAILDDEQMREGMRVVNTILLAVLGGIIGLVLSGFTGWHIYLATTGQTTIESLEKTRYLSPLRKSMERQFQPQRNYLGQEESETNNQEGEQQQQQQQSLLEHLKETHANALPGVLRPEEGESTRSHTPTPQTSLHHPNQPTYSSDSPAKDSLHRSYASLEAQRERERYTAYLDEVDSEKLPNAFDIGWKRNLLHVFGDKPLYWFLPVCNTSGDGWVWEVSPKWTEARAAVARAREEAVRNQQPSEFQPPPSQRRDYRWQPGQGFVSQAGTYAYHDGAGDGGSASNGRNMQMQPLDRRKAPSGGFGSGSDDVDSYDTSSDEDGQRRGLGGGGTANWNDIPEDFLGTARSQGSRSRSRGRRKGD